MGTERPGSQILGTGAYAPEKILTNRDIEKMVDTSDEWIRERTGIGERRIAADGEAASDLALRASQRALEAASVRASELDMIIVGTVSADHPMPACAAYLQRKLGASQIPSFDVSAACAGFLYGLAIGDQFIRTGAQKRILVVGVELLSRIINWKDRATCVLFGDGAGAVVLGPADGDGRGVLSTKLHTDASLTDSLYIPAGGSREPVTAEGLAAQRDKVFMVGSDIYQIAVKHMKVAVSAALQA